jgi:citrate synthase
MTYDPAFMNTASCKSRITFIDGDKGILEYRGYPIEQLAEKSTYLEVAYLLLHGELPTQSQLEAWTKNITYHTFINENIKTVIDGFHYNAHPMGMFEAMLGALSTFYPDAKISSMLSIVGNRSPVDCQGPDNRSLCISSPHRNAVLISG